MAFIQSPEAAFVEKWNKEAVSIYQQTESKFEGKTTEVREKTNLLHVPKFDAVVAQTGKARHQAVTISAQSTEDITVSAKPIHCSYMVDDWDRAQSSYDFRKDVSEHLAGAVKRGFDDVIIAALNASTNSEITLPTANTLDYKGVVALGEALDVNEVNEDNRFLAVSPGGWSDLTTDQDVVGNFNFKNNAIGTGKLSDVAGFEMFKTTRLPYGAAGASERRVFAWHKSAIFTLIPQDFRLTVSWENDRQAYLLVASVMAGAVIHQQAGVQFADITN